MADNGKINLKDYYYHLPEDRIAKYPLDRRDQSKLLVYQDGVIKHRDFKSVIEFIPSHATLFFNDTKVIPARLQFQKDTGAQVEIFLLKPAKPVDINLAMSTTACCEWITLIGNLKRWPSGTILHKTLTVVGQKILLEAKLTSKEERKVTFSWNGPVTFGALLDASGLVPLPPYLNREAIPQDKLRYQTVYASNQGAVAAPTAGLHFTKKILDKLKDRGVGCEYLTLHVSAGTFQPIKEANIQNHPMHSERMVVTMENLEQLIAAEKPIAIGTTSMRTLESIYWYGVKLDQDPKATFHIEKLFPYQFNEHILPTLKESCKRVMMYMETNKLDSLLGTTEIFIFPGYSFRVCQGLMTNFHLPGSTLILLVAAFVGADWRTIYDQALNNDYRFLSYGDTSLLLI